MTTARAVAVMAFVISAWGLSCTENARKFDPSQLHAYTSEELIGFLALEQFTFDRSGDPPPQAGATGGSPASAARRACYA